MISVKKVFLTFHARSRTKRKNLRKFLFLFFIFLCGASKGFMKGFKAFIRPFEGTTKKCENKNFSSFFILPQLSKMHGAGRVKYFAKFTGKHSYCSAFCNKQIWNNFFTEHFWATVSVFLQ